MSILRSITSAALMAATLAVANPASAFDINEMTDEERFAFGEEVRGYLLENPEILMELINILEGRQADEQALNDVDLVANNSDALFNDGYSWEGGNPDGDIVIVEFLDYRCGFCKRAFPEVKELVQTDGNIKIIVKEFPILGEESTLASRFALAAKLTEGDDAYSQVHDALMEMRGQVTPASLGALSDRLGFNTDKVIGAMQLPEIDRILAENRELANRMAINGTPSFVIGTQMLRGYAPLEGMREIVADQRG